MGHHPVEDSNRSDNTTINTVLEQHLSRRQILRGGATAATMVAGASLVACGGDSNSSSNNTEAPDTSIDTPVAEAPQTEQPENEDVADAKAYCHFYQFYLFVDHAKYSMEIEEVK